MNKEPKNSLEVIQCDYNFQGQNLKVHFGLMKYMFLKIFSLFSGEHNKQKKTVVIREKIKMEDGGPNLQASNLYCEHTQICKLNTTTMASSYRGLWFEAELDATMSCNTV